MINKETSAIISIIESDHGEVVKKFSWSSGKLQKAHGAQIYSGRAISIEVDIPKQLEKVLGSLKPQQAISIGTLKEKNRWFSLSTTAARKNGQIARSKKFFKFPPGPAWLPLDIDTKDLPATLVDKTSERNLWEVIQEAVPELRNTAHVVRQSSSSGIVTPNGSVNRTNALHVYIRVQDARLIPKFLKHIHDTLWVAGLGYFCISKNGSLLERSLVDLTVGSPERLFFESAPKIIRPLTRLTPNNYWKNGVTVQNIFAPDEQKVQRFKAEEKRILLPESNKTKKKYEEAQVSKLCQIRGIPKSKALRLVRMRNQTQVLTDDDLIETSKNNFESVGDFLERATVQVSLPCPIEGSEYGLSTAYFYPPDAYDPVARIISFAHGEATVFHFERYRFLKGLQWLPSLN
ncbi:MAG: hypothetical protein H8E32_01765 [Nitrospinae bacterium]|nr:hypothetical protein [Nitrospinota bacterium]